MPRRCERLSDEQRKKVSRGVRRSWAKRLGNKPLEVQVKNATMVITVGIHTMAEAFERSEYNNPWDEMRNGFVKTYTVIEPHEFADDIKRELLREREDGSSPLSDLLDNVSIKAVEDGSLGIMDTAELAAMEREG